MPNLWDNAESFLRDILSEDNLGIDDVWGVGLRFENDDWFVSINAGDFTYTVDLESEDLPDWVWDDLYYLADEFDWDWETTYEDGAAA